MQWLFIISMMVCLLCPGYAAAEDAPGGSAACDPWISKVVSIQGTVEVKRSTGADWRPTRLEETYCPGDRIRVGANSRAAIQLHNDTVMRLDQRTTIVFTGVESKTTFLLDLLRGAAHFFSRRPRSLKVSTPFVNGVVKGTEFLIRVDQDKARINMYEGRILAQNDQGDLLLVKGQAATVLPDQKPRLETVVRPRDASHWTLYYPPILYMDPSQFDDSDTTGWQGAMARSMDYYRVNDLTNAHRSIAQAGEDVADVRFYLYRAGLRLAVGRTTEAKADIDRSLTMDPLNSDAWALRAIMAVVQNQKSDAQTAAKNAVNFNPDSAAARVALSYVLQAKFELDDAHQQALIAVEKEPDNGIAWARLAQLSLSLEMQDAALDAAQRATELHPGLAPIQTVYGYAFLAQLKARKAQDAFRRAIELDSAAPLPRLGLGLAQIHQGGLAQGRSQIEIAAGLDPGNALIRSYLAKAYFDERRDGVSAKQLATAKELDPADPTPWFYDAIRKQTLNRPVEALHDIQTSMRLNDNRAVYRSKLALDSDLAARSASVGRIYRDLGFEQLALIQGRRSLELDPGNHSAHRFLADSYSDLPRHEVARVSELLQSQLLQPINITPVQPQMAESGLSILEGTGPTDQAFNEFNPLFLRNRLALQVSGVLGTDDTAGHDVVQSGMYNNLSYSVGHFHYQTDGFRENNDQRADVANIFTQARLSHRASLLAEYRFTDTSEGDLPLRFDPENFLPFFRENVMRQSIRIGGRYGIDRRNDLIATAIYGKLKGETFQAVPEFGIEFEEKLNDDGILFEAQHFYRSRRISLISGLGHFRGSESTRQSVNIGSVDRFKNPVDQTTPYIYSLLRMPDSMTWIVGASADFYDRLDDDRSQLNPKLGLTWRITPMTTLRTAAFRTLQRNLIADQTIEPTQVAGFNQFFDESNGTSAWRYGAAADQKFSPNVFGGISVLYSDLEVSYEDLEANVQRAGWEVSTGQFYLFWTPSDWMSTGIRYRYERLRRADEFVGVEQFARLESHLIPVQIRLFCPIGLTLELKGTYVNQGGDFNDPDVEPTETMSDRFFLVDAAVSYRLPKRYGILTITAKNLFDEEFNYQDTNSANPEFVPQATFVAKLALNF